MKTREQILADEAAKDSSGLTQFLAGLGASFARRDPSAVIGGMEADDDERKRQALRQYDQGLELDRKNVLNTRQDEDYARNLARSTQMQTRDDEDYSRKMELEKAESDPMSPQSLMAQELAVKMGMDPEKAKGLSASKFKAFSPTLEKMYTIKEKAKSDKERAQEKSEEKAAAAATKKEAAETKQAEKDFGLATPYGKANTVEDAKQVKSAVEAKANFDSKLAEMIALRKKHGGGAIFNREDVERGKQLSKDLLLQYKDMAKLGVLSQSDENILNAIIPPDPLAYDFVPGQDPILHRLEKFSEDADRDFKTRVQTRTRDGGATQPTAPVRVQAPDGSIRMIPADQVKNAVAAGGKVVDG